MGRDAYELHEMVVDLEIDEMFSNNNDFSEEGLTIVTTAYLFREDVNSADYDLQLMLDIYHGFLPRDAMPEYDPAFAAVVDAWVNQHHTHMMPEDLDTEFDEPMEQVYPCLFIAKG